MKPQLSALFKQNRTRNLNKNANTSFLSISFIMFLKFKPDVIVTTGEHTCVAMCYIAKIIKKKVIYIESFANIETKTLTGKLIYPIADKFIVQWKSMLKLYPKAIYEGWIF